jgi:hypothetical protein
VPTPGAELRVGPRQEQPAQHGSHLSSFAADRSSNTNRFVVLAQVPVPSRSGKSAFHDPAPGQNLEARARFGTVHDGKGPVRGLPDPVPEFGAGVAGICPEALQRGLRFFSRARINQMPSRSWRSVGCTATASSRPWISATRCVYDPLPSCPRRSLGPPLSVFTDWLSRSTALGPQGIMEPLPDILPPPHPEVVVCPRLLSNGLECLQARAQYVQSQRERG